MTEFKNLQLEAYPHVCGATHPDKNIAAQIQGLSPRVWGNRPWLLSEPAQQRPIPTCVGQPHFPKCHR